MSVIVTGGAGLLGAALVRQLLDRGVQRPVVMDIAWSPDRLRDVIDQIEYVNADLGNFSKTLTVVKQCQPRVIYHIGAMLGRAAEDDPAGAIRINALGTFYLMEAARLFDVPQFLFASSTSTFGYDIEDEPELHDKCLQRPTSFYAVTKLFNEGTGLFYKRKYGLDYRGIRYPSIVGPGLRVGGVLNYTAAMIEYSIKGEAYTADVEPRTKVPVVHIHDAARAMLDLGEAPVEKIKTVNYLIDGVKPPLSAGEMAERVKRKLLKAQIDFEPNPELQALLDKGAKPIDDSPARQEWGWEPKYDYDMIIDDFRAQAKPTQEGEAGSTGLWERTMIGDREREEVSKS